MAEKQRRDNLNANISTMATLVPSVAGSSRRMDKISILRLATAFLRTRYSKSTLLERFSHIIPRSIFLIARYILTVRYTKSFLIIIFYYCILLLYSIIVIVELFSIIIIIIFYYYHEI